MDIVKMFKTAGACDAGVCAFDALLPFMDEEKRQKAQERCPGARSVAIGAFSYYVNPTPGNLSLYTRGEDYHKVLTRRLAPVCAALEAEYPGKRFVSLADSSPLPEKVAAMKAGLGYVGQNCLFISNSGGSFVFMACILTDQELEATDYPLKTCSRCGKCIAACPTGAIGPGRPIDRERCLTAMSQRKGELESWEAEALKKAPSAWGCDICQLACPANAGLPETGIEEFCGTAEVPYLPSLAPEALEGLSNRQFEREYGCRAFSFRGRETILRDLKIHK